LSFMGMEDSFKYDVNNVFRDRVRMGKIWQEWGGDGDNKLMSLSCTNCQ